MSDIKRIICLAHDQFEDLELWYPVLRLQEEGVIVKIAGEKQGKVYHGKYGVPAHCDVSYKDLKIEEYNGILIPGGWAPDKLRRFPEVIRLVYNANEQNKIIGQICHAGWVTISAKILKGRKVTSTPAIRDDMENAGASWSDEAVVVDGNLISSRRPGDLPFYGKALIEAIR